MITKIGYEVVKQAAESDSKRSKWVVPAAIAGGTALGAGALYGLNQAGLLGEPVDLGEVGTAALDKLHGAGASISDAAGRAGTYLSGLGDSAAEHLSDAKAYAAGLGDRAGTYLSGLGTRIGIGASHLGDSISQRMLPLQGYASQLIHGATPIVN